MEHPNLVIAWTCASHPEADVAKCTLEAAGIPAMIQADTAGGMREHLAWSGAGFKIFVREEDLAAARDILSAPDATDQIPQDEFPSENALPPGGHRTN